MPQSPQSAIVFGATGLVGRALVERLCVLGHNTTAHVRPDSPTLQSWEECFGNMGATFSSVAFDSKALCSFFEEHRFNWVFLCLGSTRKRLKKDGESTYQKVDIGLNKLIVDALANASPGRVTMVSSLGANPEASSGYLRAKGQAETILATSGLPFTIVRPSVLAGDRAEPRLGEILGASVLDGFVAWLPGIGDRFKSISGPNLAAVVADVTQDAQMNRHVLLSQEIQQRLRQIKS